MVEMARGFGASKSLGKTLGNLGKTLKKYLSLGSECSNEDLFAPRKIFFDLRMA